MAVTRSPRTGPRLDGGTLFVALLALLIAGPLIALPASFLTGRHTFGSIGRELLPRALGTSLLIGVGVGFGTLLLGGTMAMLVSFYDFPGRRILDWALILPLSMPGYVLTFVLLAQYGRGNALQSNLLGHGLHIPGLQTPAGAIAILSIVLYPYVYALGRAAFLSQSRQSFEAARALGRSYRQAIWQVAVPMARPGLSAGAALAVMESLADFGTVDLLGLQALPNAIYRVWFGAGFDRDAAFQLATVLVGLALTMLSIERLLRGRARYHQNLGRGDAIVPRRLSRTRGIAVTAALLGFLGVFFALPVSQLLAWSIESLGDGSISGEITTAAKNTVLLAGVTVAACVVVAMALAFVKRRTITRLRSTLLQLTTLGYAIPGTVVAVAVYRPLIYLDRHLIDWGESLGLNLGLVFTGSILGLVMAYAVRFNALAFFSIDSQLSRVSRDLDDSARALGADRARVSADIHVPLLRPGLATAALLVMVEVIKELPVTALLRPLGRDTLAITVWEATRDSRLDTAAFPALLIVAVGLIPVLLMIRSTRSRGWKEVADGLG